jgi:hypothetical protein
MCCLHLQGASRINWGLEKCKKCRIIARIVHGKNKGKGHPRTGHEGQREVDEQIYYFFSLGAR